MFVGASQVGATIGHGLMSNVAIVAWRPLEAAIGGQQDVQVCPRIDDEGATSGPGMRGRSAPGVAVVHAIGCGLTHP